MDLITEYNHLMWECNHLAHRSPENKKNVGICWAKSLNGFKLNATYVNIMQHSPTWCTNERNMLAQRVAFVCTALKAPCKRTQHVGATSPIIVGIVLADVGFRVFKRPQHVGQCCFYGNTLGSMGLIFIQNSLLNCNVVTFVSPLPVYGAR